MSRDAELTSSDFSNRMGYKLRHALPEILIGLFASLLLAVTLWREFDQTSIIVWSGIALILYLIRFIIAVRTQNAGLFYQGKWIVFTLIMLLTGALWAVAALGVFSLNDNFLTGSFLLWLVCLLFTVAIVYQGSLSMLFAFGVPAIGCTLLLIQRHDFSFLPYLTTALITLCCFIVLLSLIARRFRIDQEAASELYDTLNQKYALLQEEANELTLSLSTTRHQHEQTQEALKNASSSLSSCQSSKTSLVKTLQTTLKDDPLTHLANRRGFFEVLDKEWQRSIRSHDPLTLAFISIDDFDDISKDAERETLADTLKTIGKTVKSHGRRAGDMHGRIDKSDFALLLQGADAHNAARIIENIRESISEMDLKASDDGKPVTVHAGLATLVPNRQSRSENLVERVESATYEAAFKGGDRVVTFNAFSDVESVPWVATEDGELTVDNFTQKMLKLGYPIKREIIPPRTRFRDQSFNRETLFAVFSGVFRLNVEGQVIELKRGAHIVMPEGVSFNAEVVDSDPVHLYLEDRD